MNILCILFLRNSFQVINIKNIIQCNLFLTLKNGYVLTIITHICFLIMICKFYNDRRYLASVIYSKKCLLYILLNNNFLVEYSKIHFITYIMKYKLLKKIYIFIWSLTEQYKIIWPVCIISNEIYNNWLPKNFY